MRLFLTTCLTFLWVCQGFAAFNLTWGLPAVSLDANPPFGDTDLNPKVAIDSSGNAIATWGRTTSRGASEDIWVASYSHTARVWTGPIKVSEGGNASHSNVAMDAAGNAIVIWEEGFPTQIKARSLSANGIWSPPLSSSPQEISSSIGEQRSPQISMDGMGNALAIWMELVEGKHHIHSAKKTAGLDWESLGVISANAQNESLPPIQTLALNDSGSGIAAWQENGSEIHGALYSQGQWLPPLVVSAIAGEISQAPAVGIDQAGKGIIVWNQVGATSTIQSKTFSGGGLSEAPLLASDPSFFAQRPHVGVDAMGNAIVVFERFDVGFGTTPSMKFVVGATLPLHADQWKAPVDLSGPSFDPTSAIGAGCPLLYVNAIGDGVVIWKEFNGTHRLIQGAGVSLGTWSTVKTLSSIENDASTPFSKADYNLGVAVNVAGNIIAIWPEDPSNQNAQQIKAAIGVGLAMEGPFPPSPLSQAALKELLLKLERENALPLIGTAAGFQILHRFPGHGDLINVLNWSTPGDVSYYKIYRDNLSSLIGTSKEPHFEDHQRIPKRAVTYLITSVDEHEHESGPLTIIVKPR